MACLLSVTKHCAAFENMEEMIVDEDFREVSMGGDVTDAMKRR
jgi:hypothetical protein